MDRKNVFMFSIIAAAIVVILITVIAVLTTDSGKVVG